MNSLLAMCIMSCVKGMKNGFVTWHFLAKVWSILRTNDVKIKIHYKIVYIETQ